MLEAIAIILLLLWALGLASSTMLGGYIHILLLLAIATMLLRVAKGKKVVGHK